MLPLGEQAVFWLGQYITQARPRLLKGGLDEPALCIDLHGKALHYGALQQILNRHATAAGIDTPVSPHSLRRACATHMLQHGAHPLQLQLLLGHSTLGTLSQYLRLTITDLKKTHARSKPGK